MATVFENFLSPPVNTHNSPVWSACKKKKLILSVSWYSEGSSSLILWCHRAYYGIMAGVCFNGTGRLHFVADKAKINADYYVRELLPTLEIGRASCRERV